VQHHIMRVMDKLEIHAVSSSPRFAIREGVVEA